MAERECSIDIPRSWTSLFWGTLLALPTGLGAEISGSKEAEVLKVRKAIVGNDLTTATEDAGTVGESAGRPVVSGDRSRLESRAWRSGSKRAVSARI